MSTANEVVAWLNLAAYTTLGAVALRHRLGHRDPASGWAALAFGGLAAVVLFGRFFSDDPGELELRLQRVLTLGLILFPYFLYRFMRAFSDRRGILDLWVLPLTAALVVATLALPRFPEEGESDPWWFTLFLAAFLVHWIGLSLLVTVRLWRAAGAAPSVARKRMRWLAAATAALSLAIVFVAAGPGDDSALSLAAGLVGFAAAIAFVLGFAPPAAVKFLWRRPEEERFAAAVARLMGATSEREVATEILPLVARLVGAHAGVLADEDGTVVATHGSAPGDGSAELRLPFAGGTLTLSASRYAPFFGVEELRLVESLAALTGLALDRSRLFAQERLAREALERADQIKTQFVALAAHELRTPVGNLHGTVDTLDRLGAGLPEAERLELWAVLRTQTDRLRLLAEQLLDLTRLEAEAVELSPAPTAVRERVEEIVAGTVGTGAASVSVEIDPGLEAVVDAAAFDRVIANLVANALRYGSPPIRVAAEQRDRHFRVTVEDRGPGVPEEFEPLLFERFTRSEHSSRSASGTGLGLAIARSYARAHGGDLVYHRAEPSGARFELVLPRRPASERSL